MVVKQLQFNEKVKISCTEFTLLHKKNTPKRGDLFQWLPVMKPLFLLILIGLGRDEDYFCIG